MKNSKNNIWVDESRMEILLEFITVYSRKNLTSIYLLRSLNRKRFNFFIITMIFTILSVLTLIIMLIIELNYGGMKTSINAIMLILIVQLLYYELYSYNLKKKKVEYRKLKIDLLRSFYQKHKVSDEEILVLCDLLKERSQENKVKSLRFSAAFAILLLPFWEEIVKTFLLDNISSRDFSEFTLKGTLIFTSVLILMFVYLFIERLALIVINQYANLDYNIQKLSRCLITRKGEL